MKTLLPFVFFVSLAAGQPRSYLKEFTRPANNTTYTAGDNVCASDSLPILLVAAGEFDPAGKLTFIHLAFDTSNTANATFRLWLYSDSLGQGKVADNAAFANSMVRDSLMYGYVDFTLNILGQSGGTVSIDGATNFVTPFVKNIRSGSSGSRGLWGRLIATGAYVPKLSGRVRIKTVIEHP